MKGKNIISFLALVFCLIVNANVPANGSDFKNENHFAYNTQLLYQQLKSGTTNMLPSWDAFSLALKGYNNLKSDPSLIQKDIITVVDFSLSSSKKRLWVIDLAQKKVLFNDWVAHGKKSGNNFAKSFSNLLNSNASSIGFYVTGEKYNGKHGLSLRLDGMDKGFNDNARKRAIVMHGAKYVSGDFIKEYGRLGRSLGCPSLSMSIYKDVIDAICEGSVLFIYSPNNEFIAKSSVLNPEKGNTKLASARTFH